MANRLILWISLYIPKRELYNECRVERTQKGWSILALERLDKILASQGVGSRKDAGALIRKGAVEVNGQVVRRPEEKVDGERDTVCVCGKSLKIKKYLYIMMNKPKGVLSAARDSRTPTVIDLLPESLRRRGLFPAGRLDKDTTGLLIITDDGEMAHRMLAPKKHVMKRYEAILDIPADESDVAAFAEGIPLKDFVCMPASLELENGTCIARVEVQEGKFHQVKRMFAARGKTVLSLKRLQVGKLNLDEHLQPGESRELTAEEVALIFS